MVLETGDVEERLTQLKRTRKTIAIKVMLACNGLEWMHGVNGAAFRCDISVWKLEKDALN